MFRVFHLTQERIVLLFSLILLVAFALFLPRFLTADNLLSLVRSVSVVGILGVAMGLVVIGRGIDLSLVALMAVSLAWTLQLVTHGMPLAGGLALGLVFSLTVGAITGFLIAYIEIPAIFATLAMGTLIYGFWPVLPHRSRCHLSARGGAFHRLDRHGTSGHRPDPRDPVRRGLHGRRLVSPLHQIRPLHPRDRRQHPGHPGSPACRCARSS